MRASMTTIEAISMLILHVKAGLMVAGNNTKGIAIEIAQFDL
jgi:hypothetical protein